VITMLFEADRQKLHTDCELFEWDIEEDVNVIAYDRMELDVTYVANCLADQTMSTCKSAYCPLYRQGHSDNAYPGVELKIKAYG